MTMSCSTLDIISNLPCNVLEKILVCLMTIYKVLLLHQGPLPLLKFTLSLADLESCLEIDQLIFFVSKNGIREFKHQIRKGEAYKLPSTLFLCLQLEHLNLRSCVFKPPPGFKGFTGLVSLKLYDVLIAGLFRSICIRIPCVACVTVFMRGSRNRLGFNEGEISNSVIRSLPVVTFLVLLDYSFVKCMAAGGLRERLPTLNHLVSLQLHDSISFGEPDVVSAVLYFIRSSPNLQVLDIRVETEFIRLLLAKSPMLHTMHIELKSKVVAERSRILEELTGFRRASAQAVIIDI
ncbi:hypothetical protein C3L33_22208, partial [Rhododendron williamsianum]